MNEKEIHEKLVALNVILSSERAEIAMRENAKKRITKKFARLLAVHADNSRMEGVLYAMLCAARGEKNYAE